MNIVQRPNPWRRYFSWKWYRLMIQLAMIQKARVCDLKNCELVRFWWVMQLFIIPWFFFFKYFRLPLTFNSWRAPKSHLLWKVISEWKLCQEQQKLSRVGRRTSSFFLYTCIKFFMDWLAFLGTGDLFIFQLKYKVYCWNTCFVFSSKDNFYLPFVVIIFSK